uniref:FAD-binding PCMH-type domain-containing protein n=2 Tax=Clytia hemisphaerica TaxID=252671 RepID=A0A7M5XHT2_9CNID
MRKKMFVIKLLLLYALLNVSFCSKKKYCEPDLLCWPSQIEWNDFDESLNGTLHQLSPDDYEQCEKQGDNAFNISSTGNGICMQYHDCSRQFCQSSTSWNIPAYSVEVKSVRDVQLAIAFANKYNIAVSIKTSGHSYAGSSMGKSTLLIWTRNLPEHLKTVDDVKQNFTDSCGTVFTHAVKVGGGQRWNSVYKALNSKYHIVGGGGLTVSAAGGWLQGCGLSSMSRKYGIGIDNVIDFDVVLANGSCVTVDKCTNPDLFWALRGGGGGTWGVVTAVHYKIRPAEPILEFYMNIANIGAPWYYTGTVDSWLEEWVKLSPNLDNRWGGYWTLNTLILYFVGSEEDAKATFINDFNKWKNDLPALEKLAVTTNILTADSYFNIRGGYQMDTDKTGERTINIASRLIPREFVLNEPEEALEHLKWMVRNGFFTFNYLLGGVVMDPSKDETAVHPAMRKAVWQIETFQDEMTNYLRENIKNTGAGFNHAWAKEPDWRNSLWGEHLEKLQELKKKYDSENRFNCWHCIGYQGDEYPRLQPEPSLSPSTSLEISSSSFMSSESPSSSPLLSTTLISSQVVSLYIQSSSLSFSSSTQSFSQSQTSTTSMPESFAPSHTTFISSTPSFPSIAASSSSMSPTKSPISPTPPSSSQAITSTASVTSPSSSAHLRVNSLLAFLFSLISFSFLLI